jgi:hypothetical protein
VVPVSSGEVTLRPGGAMAGEAPAQ